MLNRWGEHGEEHLSADALYMSFTKPDDPTSPLRLSLGREAQKALGQYDADGNQRADASVRVRFAQKDGRRFVLIQKAPANGSLSVKMSHCHRSNEQGGHARGLRVRRIPKDMTVPTPRTRLDWTWSDDHGGIVAELPAQAFR